jgi:hypothetical protein
MDSEKAEPAAAAQPVQGDPAAQYTLFEKLLKKTAKILRQTR